MKIVIFLLLLILIVTAQKIVAPNNFVNRKLLNVQESACFQHPTLGCKIYCPEGTSPNYNKYGCCCGRSLN